MIAFIKFSDGSGDLFYINDNVIEKKEESFIAAITLKFAYIDENKNIYVHDKTCFINPQQIVYIKVEPFAMIEK